MSAAEKLRALSEALGPEAVLEMTDIPLPQIVAVVEAAEYAAAFLDATMNPLPDGGSPAALVRSRNALAALDEALV